MRLWVGLGAVQGSKLRVWSERAFWALSPPPMPGAPHLARFSRDVGYRRPPPQACCGSHSSVGVPHVRTSVRGPKTMGEALNDFCSRLYSVVLSRRRLAGASVRRRGLPTKIRSDPQMSERCVLDRARSTGYPPRTLDTDGRIRFSATAYIAKPAPPKLHWTLARATCEGERSPAMVGTGR